MKEVVPRIIQTKGKRKTAIARAVFKPGKGRIRINKKPLEIYEPEYARMRLEEPIIIAKELGIDEIDRVDVEITVKGGGFMGQTEAARMALARGLVEWTGNLDLRKAYMEYDPSMLKGDPRRKEPKKFGGHSHARKRRQKSYR